MLINRRDRQVIFQLFVAGEGQVAVRFIETVAKLTGGEVERTNIAAIATYALGMVEGWSVQVELQAPTPPVALGSLIVIFKGSDGVLITLDPPAPDITGRLMDQFKERTREQGYLWSKVPALIFASGGALGPDVEGVRVLTGNLSTGEGVLDAVKAVSKSMGDVNLPGLRGKPH